MQDPRLGPGGLGPTVSRRAGGKAAWKVVARVLTLGTDREASRFRAASARAPASGRPASCAFTAADARPVLCNMESPSISISMHTD